MGIRTNGNLAPKQKTSKVLWKWEFEQMGILTTFSAWPAKWKCCMLAFAWCLLPPHNILFLNPTGSKMWNAFDKLKTFTVNQTNKCVWKTGCRFQRKVQKLFTNNEEVCAGDYNLQEHGFTICYKQLWNSSFLLFKLGKFAWKLFLLCGGFICWETCDCSSARFGQVIKWESDNKKQGKYRENGNSNKWEFRLAFLTTRH